MSKSKTINQNFYSNLLGKEMAMTIFLPENIDIQQPLPVLYFLHGRSGDEDILFEAGISEKADQLISSGEIKPMMIVCPRIENSRGLNSSKECSEILNSENRIYNVGMYEDYLIKELVPFIDQSYHTIQDRKGRYIGGASAGGYAALHNAFRHQELFCKVGGHMPAIELTLEEEDKPHFKSKEDWEKYDPVHIAGSEDIRSDFQVYLDAGDKDEGRFYEGCSILNKILKEKGISVQNHLFKGHHNVEYLKTNIKAYLKFYGRE
ncbi:MAG TPA: alpha/beta hydrolase-fold protein [Prolixibacteraceae bacterium]|nr:alpha/beta hydrolase-fold protein [Prolixibacteraceae bacterium]